MGKNRVLRTLGKRIGNVVLHKLLVKYTNKPESKGHLQSEEVEYRSAALRDTQEYHWSEEEKQALKKQALVFVMSRRSAKYEDVAFLSGEAEKLIDEEIRGFGI